MTLTRDERDIQWLQENPVPDAEKPKPLSTPVGPPDSQATELLRHRLLGGVDLRPLSAVTAESVQWLWPGRIPFGKLTILDGNPGQGKSTLTMAVMAAMSVGSGLLDWPARKPEASVIVSAEDGLSDTILPRLKAYGADLSQITALEAVLPEEEVTERPFRIPEDIENLRYTIKSTHAKLVVIDPLMAFLSGHVNYAYDHDVRRALHPLKNLAAETGAAILLVRHLNKSTGGLAITRGGGSIGIIGAARVGLLVGLDPNDSSGQGRILAVSKNNLAALHRSISFHLEPVGEVAIASLDGYSEHTAETILAAVDPEDVADVGRAGDIIKCVLSNGAVPAIEAIRTCRNAGLTDKHIQRARRMLGVFDIPGNPTYWELKNALHTAPSASEFSRPSGILSNGQGTCDAWDT